MNQIIYNSFPRSGNVYAGYVGSHIIWGDYATVHIPQIFGTKDLDMISIFRKPEDAISSLINKKLETGSQSSLTDTEIQKQCNEMSKEYKKYMFYAKEHATDTYIIKFDEFLSNPVDYFIDISNKFNKTLLKDYEISFKSLKFSGKLWEDKHDGHIPREKDDMRLFIDKTVGSLNFIQDLNQEYLDFIEQNKSYKGIDI